MAKSARSSSKKQLRTYRRENLKVKWQAEADAKRYAALAACVNSEPLPVQSSAPVGSEDMEEDRGRQGRSGKASAMDMSDEVVKSSKRKGFKVGKKGVPQKQRRKGKLFLAGKNQFHKKGKK